MRHIRYDLTMQVKVKYFIIPQCVIVLTMQANIIHTNQHQFMSFVQYIFFPHSRRQVHAYHTTEQWATANLQEIVRVISHIFACIQHCNQYLLAHSNLPSYALKNVMSSFASWSPPLTLALGTHQLFLCNITVNMILKVLFWIGMESRRQSTGV